MKNTHRKFVKRTEIGYVFKEAGCLNYAVKISSRLFQNRSDIFANSFGLTLNCIFFYVAVCRVYCYLPEAKRNPSTILPCEYGPIAAGADEV